MSDIVEFVMYCDESSDKGKKYGDFFGGCLVSSEFLHEIEDALNAKKRELNLNGEIKWTKVTSGYLEKYKAIIELFFSYIQDGKIKVRIMFRDINDLPSQRPTNGTDEKYFKLYYQFIKHAFGLKYISRHNKNCDVYLRVYLDQLPDVSEKCNKFKAYVRGLPMIKDFTESNAHLHIRDGDVAEICSHDHVLLQCTDIILGAMYFRLNELHLEKSPGSPHRGKRTIAKEKLYNYINLLIRNIIPNFNIGISTGPHGYEDYAWQLPYSHWRFRPK